MTFHRLGVQFHNSLLRKEHYVIKPEVLDAIVIYNEPVRLTW